MALDLHGRSCTVLLSQGRTGYGLILLLGTLRVAGGAVWILPKEGGDAVLVPPHLAGEIEPVTDELRESVELQLDSELCLRAYRPAESGERQWTGPRFSPSPLALQRRNSPMREWVVAADRLNFRMVSPPPRAL